MAAYNIYTYIHGFRVRYAYVDGAELYYQWGHCKFSSLSMGSTCSGFGRVWETVSGKSESTMNEGGGTAGVG